jgi:hypothetical protein
LVGSYRKTLSAWRGGTNMYAYTDSVGKPPIQTNLYQYAYNNPIRYTDPLGLDPMYWCVRIYFGPYFACQRVDDATFPPKIENVGIFIIPDATCIFNCYLTEEEWEQGRKRGDACEEALNSGII